MLEISKIQIQSTTTGPTVHITHPGFGILKLCRLVRLAYGNYN
jgi:hypothetical protein